MKADFGLRNADCGLRKAQVLAPCRFVWVLFDRITLFCSQYTMNTIDRIAGFWIDVPLNLILYITKEDHNLIEVKN